MKILAALTVAFATALVLAGSALAWHADGVTVTPKCENGTNTISATIQQSSSWPNAIVKSITPSSFAGNVTGSQTVVVKIGWANSNETQSFTKTISLTACNVPPPPVCPEGYTSAGLSNGVLLCTKETTKTVEVEKIVYVDKPVEKIVTVEKEVPGPTTTVYVDRPVPVEVPVVATSSTHVEYVTKWKIKRIKSAPRVVIRTIYKTKIVKGFCPKPDAPGVHRNGVEGSG